jgi:hypothetical protein
MTSAYPVASAQLKALGYSGVEKHNTWGFAETTG